MKSETVLILLFFEATTENIESSEESSSEESSKENEAESRSIDTCKSSKLKWKMSLMVVFLTM